MRDFLIYAFLGNLLAGSMLGLLLSGNSAAGLAEGLAFGFGAWLTMLGWAFFRASA